MSRSPLANSVPFSRPVDAGSIADEGLAVTIAAGEAERAALARLNGLEAIDRLEAELTISRQGRSGLRVQGVVKACVRQICVASLDPFEAELVQPLDVQFLPEADVAALQAKRSKAREADEPEDDLPDPIVGGRIDLGALAAEFLTLGLDPYPRKPGVAFVEPDRPVEERPENSPFAALSRLRS